MGFQDVIDEVKAIEERQRLEAQDMTVDETNEQRLQRLYDERDHYRDSVSVERAQRLAAEALLEHATRFIFGHYAAMNFYWGEPDFATRWAVYRMTTDQRVEECLKRDVTMAEACEMAMRWDAGERQ